MKQVFLVSLLLRPKGEHGTGRMFEEFTEILRTQRLFDLMHVFSAQQVLPVFSITDPTPFHR
jgi:hypothetical protein